MTQQESGFQHNALGDLAAVGQVTQTSARFWMRSQRPGKHELELVSENGSPGARLEFEVPDVPEDDGTHSIGHPEETGGDPLQPGQWYRWRVRRLGDGAELGSGRLATAPRSPDEAPDRFSIGILSCNQPFDAAGRARRRAQKTVGVLPRAFEDHEVRRVIMLGDQMYADYPPALSLLNDDYFSRLKVSGRRTLLDCTREEVRRLYQQRYRIYWGLEPVKKLHQAFPSYLIPDDHEIYDNFGAAPSHRQGALGRVGEGALDACYDYQGLRTRARVGVRPPSLHCAFEYGPLAAFIMDLRSQKRAVNGKIHLYGEDQFAALEDYLAHQAHRPVFLLGLSVPLVHLPTRAATWAARLLNEGSDLADRWDHERATHDRRRLARVLRRHQQRHADQRIIIVAGDIHVGLAHRLHWTDSDRELVQFVSSPVSNVEGRLFRTVARWLPLLTNGWLMGEKDCSWRVRLLEGSGAARRNPFAGLNAGIIELTRKDGRWETRLKIVSHVHGSRHRYRIPYRSVAL